MFRYLVYSWIFSSSLSLCEIPLAAAVIASYSFDEALGNETVYGVDASEEALWASDMARGPGFSLPSAQEHSAPVSGVVRDWIWRIISVLPSNPFLVLR